MARARPTQAQAAGLAELLRARLAHYVPGSRLPGTAELARNFDVSEHTARSALAMLTAEGLLAPRERGGHFVRRSTAPAGPAVRRVVALLQVGLDRSLQHQSILAGVDARCRQLGLQLTAAARLIAPENFHPDQLHAQIALGRGRDLGVLTASISPPEPVLTAWMGLGTPVVIVGAAPPPGVLVNAVLADHEGATHSATERLIMWGHRRIAYLGPNFSDSEIHASRIRGYRLALEGSGTAADPGLLWTGREASDPCDRTCLSDRLGDPRHRPTAVLCGNQRIGIELLDFCRHEGIAVPQELSVVSVGFQRREWADRVGGLSRFNEGTPEDLGRRGVDLLMEYTNQARPAVLYSRAEWIDAGSAGPPSG